MRGWGMSRPSQAIATNTPLREEEHVQEQEDMFMVEVINMIFSFQMMFDPVMYILERGRRVL